MSVANIVDKRTNPYHVKCDAAFEPSFHDNEVENASQFDVPLPSEKEEFTYDERINTSVFEAVKRGNTYRSPVTVYLYDPNTLNEGSK